jgi:hypothetical protein
LPNFFDSLWEVVKIAQEKTQAYPDEMQDFNGEKKRLFWK